MITEWLIEPEGWPCALEDCRPGLFMAQEQGLSVPCVRTADGRVYECGTGVFFWDDAATTGQRRKLIVQPVICRMRERRAPFPKVEIAEKRPGIPDEGAKLDDGKPTDISTGTTAPYPAAR